jgi:hypothetical protein
MTTLHILRSEPDALTRALIDGLNAKGENDEIDLYGESVDYRSLVESVMHSERVICWW